MIHDNMNVNPYVYVHVYGYIHFEIFGYVCACVCMCMCFLLEGLKMSGPNRWRSRPEKGIFREDPGGGSRETDVETVQQSSAKGMKDQSNHLTACYVPHMVLDTAKPKMLVESL